MAISVSLQCLGLIILAAVLLQTIAVAVSFMYFNKVLSSTMADRFQKEISSAMRNKLTGVLPILGPNPGVPLPKVAAHVTGVASSTETPATEGSRSSRGYLGERVRAWEGERGLSFLQNMELRGGELLVPRAGLYHIYAQTYFRLPSTGETEGEAKGDMGETKEEEGAQLVQYIYKKMSSYTVPILLMKSSRSACWPRGQEPGLFSLHQAGTAFLQPADRLFITVSNASTMEMDGRASYFGAFLVG
ncbi:tumor necrosis factor ligand superfamily member 10-like isoform X2 [Toxotes jaculatrix]|uniref:tumor necrosis factor ligand superfamily member 10-like isoform X2 n=1 Tax=Toxotes jaculatrix TaxID=941984 RepID=UPI001B3AA093|nr:tumor necrosis factor ligand superfamily member 10-like isoform X2 [Toxotes jaculatrix]